MCHKAVLGNGGTLKFVPDYYKNQEMWNKAVDNYPHGDSKVRAEFSKFNSSIRKNQSVKFNI